MAGLARGAEVPMWVDVALIPLVNLAAALVVSGLVVLVIGENPLTAMRVLLEGAVGYPAAIGFTLYYATSFIFTGLAVAIGFHGGHFNIGGEGQAYIGGLGVALVCLALDGAPWWAVLPVALVAALAFGAGWALIPAWLQATRGSHIVITTIMFNFIAAALMTYLLVDVLIAPGQSSPETRPFAPETWLPTVHEMLAAIGIEVGASPLNLAFLIAIAACVFFWFFVWRTRWGYEIRAAGFNESAAAYAGISLVRTTMLALCLGGAFAGLAAINEVMGVHHRLLLNFVAGAGFVGIAVALMGRNHPMGICLAALLFGGLYQGGAELAFELPTVTRELVIVIVGLVILFCGALENLFRPQIEALFRRRAPRPA